MHKKEKGVATRKSDTLKLYRCKNQLFLLVQNAHRCVENRSIIQRYNTAIRTLLDVNT